MANPGDVVTRTAPRGTETVYLPAIDLAHLTQVQVDGSVVKGFHVLPAGVIITSSAAVVLPPGAVAVVDRHGAAIPGAQTRITPRKLPVSEWDTLEARVEVLEATGMVVASTSQKTFFPTAWTDAQMQEAIYSAFIEAYQGGQGPLGWMAGTTFSGVVIRTGRHGDNQRGRDEVEEDRDRAPASGTKARALPSTMSKMLVDVRSGAA